MVHYSASWECPSNIALVKYWGKLFEQIPMNPSLSFTLRNSKTITSIKLLDQTEQRLQFIFEGKKSSFDSRIEKFLERIAQKYTWIRNYSFEITSENTFPHSAGIASSASAFGALALCLVDLNQQIIGVQRTNDNFFNEASYWARIGSGSACRSVYEGFNWWGNSANLKASSDEFAINVSTQIHESYFELCDAVLLVDTGTKKVSSSVGHQLMNDHPYKEARIAQANETGFRLFELMKAGDSEMEFLQIVEQEALSLHAMMMTSNPSFVLLKPNSLAIIEEVREFREQTGIPVGFTIDAGPNIHLLYWKKNQQEIHRFIQNELLSLMANGQWLDDTIGKGPVKIEQ